MDIQDKIIREDVYIGSAPAVIWGEPKEKALLVAWHETQGLEDDWIEELAEWGEANSYQVLSFVWSKEDLADIKEEAGRYFRVEQLFLSPVLQERKTIFEQVFSCRIIVLPPKGGDIHTLEQKVFYTKWVRKEIRLKLETQRLIMQPLIKDELLEILQGGSMVELSVLSDVIKGAIRRKIEKMDEAPVEVYTWFTYFLISEKESHKGIGLIGCKGLPDEEGIVEIGYAMASQYRNNGYMTEALQGFLQWLMECPACFGAELNVLVANSPSVKVAQKCGFQHVGMYDIYRVYQNIWEEA